MNFKTVMIAAFLSLFVGEVSAYARIVYFGDDVETVTISYGGPTIIRFPSDVKTVSQASRFIIGPADEQQPNYSLLSVTPRFMRGDDKVTFILGDGTIINTKLVVVAKGSPEKTDSFYDFKKKETLIEQSEDTAKESEKVSEMELMKAMIRSDQVTGYNIRKLIRTIRVDVKGIRCQLVRIYTGSRFNGYVFKLSNLTKDKKFLIDVTNLTLGSPSQALLSQIDEQQIDTAGSTASDVFLRIVAKPASVYYNINLPVTTVKKES